MRIRLGPKDQAIFYWELIMLRFCAFFVAGSSSPKFPSLLTYILGRNARAFSFPTSTSSTVLN